MTKSDVEGNKDIKNNYIRVEESNLEGSSYTMTRNSQSGGNVGLYITPDVNRPETTTESHEYGHGIGLTHAGFNQLGKGQPNIMVARNSIVDPEYQLDPNAEPNKMDGGFVNPDKRKVPQQNINDLNLGALEFINGKTNVGIFVNKYFE
ncbi:hypothetical protein CLV59_103291 [Chitinophaga dinghuensis]|uniref:Uncharacterized protein n=1 Tax=Chitinophaga dinghuensis TaxID=1539050 RepID=A0A327W212_9BACT|nr:hypothetical protein [Chitinophaga dinghuensis]RAJ83327.1 hypothetical protein CLV59_103291 [Chitinophaga dinghuensis]